MKNVTASYDYRSVRGQLKDMSSRITKNLAIIRWIEGEDDAMKSYLQSWKQDLVVRLCGPITRENVHMLDCLRHPSVAPTIVSTLRSDIAAMEEVICLLHNDLDAVKKQFRADNPHLYKKKVDPSVSGYSPGAIALAGRLGSDRNGTYRVGALLSDNFHVE